MPASENNLLGIKCKGTVKLETEIENGGWKTLWIGTTRNMQNQLAAMYLQLSNSATKSFFP